MNIIFKEIVFGFKSRHISNRAKVRKTIKHFIKEEDNVLLRGHPYPE
jgi:c-di-AMP phosphodiesterase-like protein